MPNQLSVQQLNDAKAMISSSNLLGFYNYMCRRSSCGNLICLIILIGTTAVGCSSVGVGPWPQVSVIQNNLGTGDVANYIIENRFNENNIKNIGSLLPEKISNKDLVNVEKKYGISCEKKQDDIVCKYSGSIVNRFSANYQNHDYERRVTFVATWRNDKKNVLVETSEELLK